MRKRPAFQTISDRLRKPRRFIQVLIGPRQVGKTTLALQVAETLKRPCHYATADLAALQDLAWLQQQWEVADSQALSPLLDSLKSELGEVICDGAYDCKSCYAAIYHNGGRPVIPPRKGAKPSGIDPCLRPRDMAIHRIRDQKRGRRRWKQEVGYHRRSLAETTMHRLKALTGPNLRGRRPDSQLAEVSARIYILNEMAHLRT